MHLLDVYDDPAPINVGTGEDVTIAELASSVASTVGFSGEIVYDTSRPDGTPRKVLDVSRIAATGWKPRIGLAEGLASTYRWYLDHHVNTVSTGGAEA